MEIRRIYYKIKVFLEEKITRYRFRNINNHIPFYDKKKRIFRVFFDDRYDESGSIEYVVSEYVWDGLLYEFDANGIRHHDHTFSGVLSEILSEAKKGKTISIEKYKDQYSKQEINLITKMVEKIKEDIKW